MAQNPDFKDLDELALEGGEENRDFSWEKHYPGDQGLQLQQRQRQQREEEQRRELQKSAESAYLSGEETEDEPAGPRPPVTATVSGLESGTESEGPRAMHASSSGLDISGPSAATASLPIATAGPAQGPWPYAQQAALNLGLGVNQGQPTLRGTLANVISSGAGLPGPDASAGLAPFMSRAGADNAYAAAAAVVAGYAGQRGSPYAQQAAGQFGAVSPRVQSSAPAMHGLVPGMMPAFTAGGDVKFAGATLQSMQSAPSGRPPIAASLAVASARGSQSGFGSSPVRSPRGGPAGAAASSSGLPSGQAGLTNGQAPKVEPRPAAAAGAATGGSGGNGSGTDTDDDGKLIQKAKVLATLPKPAPKKRAPTGKPRAGGGLSLKLLIDEGILWPGENVLSVEYKATMTYASLTEEGKILCKINGEPMSFDSPSAFSIYLKRLVNPSRKADDGWKTVKFAGKFLEQYKLELARRRYGNGAPGAASQAGSMATTASGASDGGASAGVSGWSGEDGPPAKKARLDSSLAKSQLKLKVPKPKSTTPKASFSLHRPEANGHILHGEQSEYARGRPKRQVKAPSRLGLNVEDPHQMVQPDKYSGTPGSGAAGAQPFRIEVSPAAQLMMDFHAHLNLNEIIGILGGTWHEEERVIRVHRAFPVRELQTEDDSINVEMDPEDEFAVREEIQQKHQLRCVGWYHSHPTFQTLPSIIDIHNQVTQQHAHRSEEAEPYVAAIVGPYDKRLADAQSSLAWFYVEHPRGKLPTPEQDPMQAGCTAMALEVTTVEDQARDAGLLNLPQGEMHQLAKRYADQPTRAEMRDVWKEGITNIEKLKASLVTRLPASWSQKLLREFFMKMEAVVMATWNVFAPQQRMAREAAQASDTEDEAEAAAVAHAREDEPEISDLTADADPKAGRNGDLDDTAGKAGRAAAGDDEEPEISGSTQEALDGGAKGRGPGPRRADVDEEMVDEELSVASSQATE